MTSTTNQIQFSSADLNGCKAFIQSDHSSTTGELEVAITEDTTDYYRRIFEKWIADTFQKIVRQESATIIYQNPQQGPSETILLVPVEITPITIKRQGNSSYDFYQVRFLVNPLPF